MVFLCVMLTKMGGYRKEFDKTKQMYFLIENNLLLKNVIISFLFKYYTLTQKIYSHQTLHLLVCQGINQQKNELLKKYNDFFFLFKCYTLTQKIYSHQAVYLLVCQGISQQKSAQKSIRYRNTILRVIQLKDLEQSFAG